MIPFVVLTLDRAYNLRCGLGAMVEIEQLTGIMLVDLLDDMTSEKYAKILWVLLKRELPDITMEQTINLVDENADNAIDVFLLVRKAIDAAVVSTGKGKNALTLAALAPGPMPKGKLNS